MTVSSPFSGKIVALVGSSGSGKSCLAQRLVTGAFVSEYVQTLGADLYVKNDVSGKNPALQLWACSGAERYRPLLNQFIEDASVVIVCFDMVRADSWAETSFWVNEAKRIVPDAVIILCGTKSDEVDSTVVKPQEMQRHASEWCVENKSVSSKTGTNIAELLELILAKKK